MSVRRVVVLDDAILLVMSDGSVRRLVAGGHAHPVGWSVEPVATQRTRAA